MKSPARTAGIDESGRGPIAGPVVASAVILPLSHGIDGIGDSKRLSPRKRKEVYDRLVGDDRVRIGIGIVEADVIDRVNIRKATLLSMRKALDDLGDPPDHVLVDGPEMGPLSVPHTPVVRGDALIEAIAAASIVAKVCRDEIMLKYNRLFPGYGFWRNKGYGTRDHLARLRDLGPCRIHRRTFEPLRSIFGGREVR